MKSIEERAEIFAGESANPNFQYDESTLIATRYASYIRGATEQKEIDDAEKAYKQGYHDAAEYILSQLKDKYDIQSKQDGYKVTCLVSRRHTPQERYERHQGFLSGILVAIGVVEKAMEEEK